MESKKVVEFKKKEFAVREYVKNDLGKGRVSQVKIEYTPVGEKIIISTHKPGWVIGKKGEKIFELTDILKKNFKLENPHIEIEEIRDPALDAQLVADDIALGLEKMGPMKFKILAYKSLQGIMNAGALGAEICMSGKIPSSRAKTWRFKQGYLRKTGDSAKIVNKAKARAETKPGTVGIKVSIIPPTAILEDKVVIDDKFMEKINSNIVFKNELKLKKSKKK